MKASQKFLKQMLLLHSQGQKQLLTKMRTSQEFMPSHTGLYRTGDWRVGLHLHKCTSGYMHSEQNVTVWPLTQPATWHHNPKIDHCAIMIKSQLVQVQVSSKWRVRSYVWDWLRKPTVRAGWAISLLIFQLEQVSVIAQATWLNTR